MSEEQPQDAAAAQEHAEEHAELPFGKKKNQKTKLAAEKLVKLKAKADKRGIVYISRLPPHLKPLKLRQMLEQYAEIGRLYLAPEDPAVRRKRKQQGGNTGKNFTEGWVEFEDKSRAKEVVAMLNGQPMGGRKRSAYYYDLWCLKYLPKFKWDHLTEELNYQRAVREQKMVAEISAAKRERDFYLSRVDRAKAQSAMEERKRKRQGGTAAGAAGPAGPGAGAGSAGTGAPGVAQQQGQQQQQGRGGGGAKEDQQQQGGQGGQQKVLRVYGQRAAKADPVTDAAAPVLSGRLLKLIAGQPKGQQQQQGKQKKQRRAAGED